MNEARIESAIVKYCEARGLLPLKLVILGARGFPDRTVLFPNGKVLFVEIKTPNGRPSHHQLKWLTKLRDMGFTATIVRSVREFHAVVNLFIQEDPCSDHTTTNDM